MKTRLDWIFFITPCLMLFSVIFFLFITNIVTTTTTVTADFQYWVVLASIFFPVLTVLTIYIFHLSNKKSSLNKKILFAFLLAVVSVVYFGFLNVSRMKGTVLPK